MKYIICIISLFAVAFTFNAKAQNGIDKSFGVNGIAKHVVSITYAGSKFVPTRLQQDAQNRLYAFGNDTINGVANYVVGRFLANGQADTTFGNNGFLFFPRAGTGTCIPPLLQADGKFLYAGYQIISGKKTIVVTRFLPNGNRDSSFANNGFGVYAATYLDDIPVDITLQSDGKIILISDDNTNRGFLTIRIQSNGAIDTSFNGTGIANALMNGSGYTKKVLVQADGKIIVAGNTYATNYKLALVRYLPNGNLDSSFGVAGKLNQSITSGNDVLLDIGMANDGNITALVNATIGNSNGVLVQWNANGVLNNSFGFSGVKNIGYVCNQLWVSSSGNFYIRSGIMFRKHFVNGNMDSTYGTDTKYNFNTNTIGSLSSVLLNGNELRLMGSVSNMVVNDLIISAVDSSGNPNNSFGNKGLVQVKVGDGFVTENLKCKVLTSLSLPDGSLIVATQTELYSKVFLSILKFLPSGARDMNFGNMGVYEPEFTNNPIGFACKLILTPDQKITLAVYGGSGANQTLRQLKLFKLETNGQLETTFGDNGFVTLVNPEYELPIKLAMQSNGKILLGLKRLQRYHTNGTLDTTFSSNFPGINNDFLDVFVLQNDKIIIANNSRLFRLDANGTFDSTFGTNGYSIQTRPVPCGDNINKPISIIYEKSRTNLVVSYVKSIKCGNSDPHTYVEWMRLTENGMKLNTIYLSDDSSFAQPSQTAINGLSYFIRDTRRSYYGQVSRLKKHASIIKKVNYNGVIDSSFNGNGIIYGETGIWNGATPEQLVYFNFESIDPISNTKFWYIRNANDTIYLSYILQPKTYGLTLSANKQNIGFGDTVRFSVESDQVILNYHWRFPGATIRYLNGTDSSSANPMVQFIHSGSFDVTLQADFTDTILTSTNKNYIVLTPLIDFTKSKNLVFVKDTLNFQSNFKGYPNSYLWQISPADHNFITGLDSNSQNPSIRIMHPGKYGVRLTLTYTDTTMSLYKPDYFESFWPVGISSLDQSNAIRIYPNPTNNRFTIFADNINETLVCEIIDLQGRILQTLQINPREQPVISLPAQAGIYLIRLCNAEGKTWVSKVVKE